MQTYFLKLAPAKNVLLVHNTFIRQADIDFINANKPAEQNVSFCLCINANKYIEDDLPPVALLRKNNCQIVLGTDSLASNHQLNILAEIKTLQQNFPFVPLEEMLGWATLNGANALQLAGQFGSFNPGKKPGIVLIENVNGNDISAATSRRIL